MEKVSTLRECTLFADFTEVGLAILASVAVPRRLAAGEFLFRAGEPSEALCIVSRGEVVLLARAAGGEPIEVGRLGRGEPLGELALLCGGRRLVTARTETGCEVLEIPRRAFAELQRTRPQACLKLLMAIARRFGQRLEAGADVLEGALRGALAPN